MAGRGTRQKKAPLRPRKRDGGTREASKGLNGAGCEREGGAVDSFVKGSSGLELVNGRGAPACTQAARRMVKKGERTAADSNRPSVSVNRCPDASDENRWRLAVL